MKAVQHPSNNAVLAPPPGVSLEECHALPYTKAHFADGVNTVISFWEPNETERLALLSGARVVLSVWGTTHPPLAVGVEGLDWAAPLGA